MTPEFSALLIEAAVKSTFIVMAAFLLVTFIRKLSSEERHLIWSLAFLGLLILPVSLWKTPEIYLPYEGIISSFSQNYVSKKQISQILATGKIERKRGESVAGQKSDNKPIVAGKITNIDKIVKPIYIGVSVLLSLYLMAIVFRISLSLQSMRKFRDPHSIKLLNDIKLEMKIKRPVRLLIHDQGRTPWTWNVLAPTVVLPSDFKEWSEEDKKNTFLHELAHIKRWDMLTILLAKSITCLYWFNPLVWLAYRHMIQESEKSCDNQVLLSGTKPTPYARQLLSVANSMFYDSILSHAPPMMASPSILSGRINAIINPDLRRNTVNKTTMLTATIITLLLSITVGAIAISPKNASAAKGAVNVKVDRSYFPVSKTDPIYPKQAFEKGTEGYVVVEYSITETGNVTDISVVESSPEGVFDQAAIIAAKEFYYAPPRVDGKLISVSGLQNKFTFRINKSSESIQLVDDMKFEALIERGPSNLKEVLTVAKAYMQKDMPEEAADFLTLHVGGSYSQDPRFHELFIKAVGAATTSRIKSQEKVFNALRRQTLKDPNGASHARLAELYISSLDWKSAFSHLVLALELGEMEDISRTKLSLGIVLYNLGRLSDAKTVFDRLCELEFDEIGSAAKQWSRYVEAEIKSREAIDAAVLEMAIL